MKLQPQGSYKTGYFMRVSEDYVTTLLCYFAIYFMVTREVELLSPQLYTTVEH